MSLHQALRMSYHPFIVLDLSTVTLVSYIVQLSSRWYPCTQESAYVLSPLCKASLITLGVPRQFCYNCSEYIIHTSSLERSTCSCQTCLMQSQESLSRYGNLHGSGMSQTMTASPKPSSRAIWRVGGAMFSGGNAGWTTTKSSHPCPCQNCTQWPPAEKTGRGSLLNHLSRTPDNPVSRD